MLQLNLIREKPDFVIERLAIKNFNGNDAVALYGDGSVGDDITSGVHGDDGGIGE